MKKYEALFKGLPRCNLLDVLYKKCSERYDVDFDFLGTINRIRLRVSAEVAQINRLFPEYTPHDEDYHLKRLFNVADTILGKKLVESMNSTELLILSCGLYCHDWGMAVSDPEKALVISVEESKKDIKDDLWILDNERELFEQFLQQHGVKRNTNKDTEQITDEIWRNYIRQTHALRSGKRAFKFFEKDDVGLANAVAKVCVGHWLDFKDIRKYPSNFTVLNETVNLRALAIYVRLIDLLDITSYRTPYVIWKYVAPQNSYSKMEWNKHRAIQSLSPRDYQQGRAIQIDGITSDHEVYASLEDMKEWCDEQFRGCNDLLAEMNDNRHKLDIYHIDWRIETSGFKPTKIRFDFDREKMFEILAEEIYQDDTYVFLRELLQNSIDAIRMRRAVRKEEGIGANSIGVIRVDVEHLDKGNAVITWTDDGIGMNEHIVRNYLAVAGKSYYSSDEFKNEGLNIDPISRFGIGILSCFGVAEQIDVETRREPYIDSDSPLLKIAIPSVTKHFRVEHHLNINNFIGTKVRVYVDGKKIFKDDEKDSKESLNVTKYLKIIAGFIEFPIIVHEHGLKTAIVHPKSDDKVIQKRFGNDYIIHKIDLGYPWDVGFLPQDLSIAKQIFEEKSNDISELLVNEGYEGVVTYLTPNEEDLELSTRPSNYDEVSYNVFYRKKRREQGVKEIRIKDIRDSAIESRGFCKSCKVSPFYTVYRDGILVSEALQPKDFLKRRGYFGYGDRLPPIRIVVNIPKSKTQKVDLARTHILGKYENWDKPIKISFIKDAITNNKDGLQNCDILERIYNMGRLSAYHNVFPSDLWDNYSHDFWPVFLLEGGGEVKCCELKEVEQDEIYKAPDIIGDELEDIVYGKIYGAKSPQIVSEWIGDRCFAALSGYRQGALSFKYIRSISNMIFNTKYQLASIRFLTSPYEDGMPLFQEVWIHKNRIQEVDDIEVVIQKAFENPLSLTSSEYIYLLSKLGYGNKYDMPRIVEFKRPFNNYFSYGWQWVNILHPIGQALIKLISFLESAQLKNKITPEQYGNLIDCIKKLPSYTNGYRYDELIDTLRLIWSKVQDLRIFNIERAETLLPEISSFVPGTIYVNGDKNYLMNRETVKKMRWVKKEFGVTIS